MMATKKSKIMVGIGIMVIAAIIGVVYPFTIDLPGEEQQVIPRFAPQWYVGKGSEYFPTLQYLVKTDEMKFTVVLKYLGSPDLTSTTDASEIGSPTSKSGPCYSPVRVQADISYDCNVLVRIYDMQTSEEFSNTELTLTSGYTFKEKPEQLEKYLDVLDHTILSVSDMTGEEKYLVVGAEWDTVFVGWQTKKITATEYGKVDLQFGSLNSYVLSYEIGEIENKFWVADDIPLPIKAEYYDADGNFDYSYELIDITGPLKKLALLD
jgi:hypothetical protein